MVPRDLGQLLMILAAPGFPLKALKKVIGALMKVLNSVELGPMIKATIRAHGQSARMTLQDQQE